MSKKQIAKVEKCKLGLCSLGSKTIYVEYNYYKIRN